LPEQSIDLICLKKTLNFYLNKLGINNTRALRSILNIAWGNSDEIDELKEKKNDNFAIVNPDLLQAIMFIIDEGTKMRNEHTKFEIKDSEWASALLYKSLNKAFYLEPPKSSKSKPDISQEEMKRMDDVSFPK
jgi:CRISPR/Cas system CMR-associated protein Cmr5 small subunit